MKLSECCFRPPLEDHPACCSQCKMQVGFMEICDTCNEPMEQFIDLATPQIAYLCTNPDCHHPSNA